MESLTALQEVVNQHQQDQERLMGTVAHLSNEMEIDKEHIKVSYFPLPLSPSLPPSLSLSLPPSLSHSFTYLS